MAYSNFKSLKKVLDKFNLNLEYVDLFSSDSTRDIESSSWLKETLHRSSNFPMNSEKARSEALIAPIFYELSSLNPSVNIFSGENLNANFELDLNGECDFILAMGRKPILETPIFGLVEAKKEDILGGYGQCCAQMLGAKILNEDEGHKLESIYGCVTTGEIWQFMKLEDQTVWIDEKRYYIDRVERILGILQWIVDQYK